MKEDRVDQIQPRVNTAGTRSCFEVERKIEKSPKKLVGNWTQLADKGLIKVFKSLLWISLLVSSHLSYTFLCIEGFYVPSISSSLCCFPRAGWARIWTDSSPVPSWTSGDCSPAKLYFSDIIQILPARLSFSRPDLNQEIFGFGSVAS